MWTLLIAAVTGGVLSSSLQTHSIQMASREACVSAAKVLSEGSVGIAFICISSETGEVIKTMKTTK